MNLLKQHSPLTFPALLACSITLQANEFTPPEINLNHTPIQLNEDDAGQHKESGRTSWSLYLDNDLFVPGSEDRDYTGGVAFSFSGANIEDHPITLDKWLSKVSNLVLSERQKNLKSELIHSCEMGFSAFTPLDISSTAPVFDDRPYSSLLYISNSQTRMDFENRSSITTSLALGALGLSAVGDIQNGIHSATGSDEANGWDNQISDGGELTGRYSLSYQKHFDISNPNLNASWSTNASIGYLTETGANVSWRWGRLRTPWWKLNNKIGSYGDKSFAESGVSSKRDELYLFGGLGLKAVAYNAFLQGQFRDSVFELSSDEINPVVGEAWLGVTKELSSGFRVSYVLRHQTSEVNTGLSDRSLTWGAFILTHVFK